jgi:hypothetical protein
LTEEKGTKRALKRWAFSSGARSEGEVGERERKKG